MAETVFELLAKEFEIAKLDEAREGSIVQVVDAAVTPDKRSFPPRALIVVLLTLIAFVMAILWVLASERWVQSPEGRGRIQALRALLLSRP